MADALDIDAEHRALVAQLRAAGTPYRGGVHNDSYTGSGRSFFNVSVPAMRTIAAAWLKNHRLANGAQVVALVDRLFVGEFYEERIVGAAMLDKSAKARAAMTLADVERWTDQMNGWAEVDSFCASVDDPAPMAADWAAWQRLIRSLAADPNINRRRAALVLLTTPTRTSDDPSFRDLAFEIVERLKGEKPILITKAVSWLLRSMVGRHGAAVTAYLDANAASLPAIAVRETKVKLATGTKSGRTGRAAKKA